MSNITRYREMEIVPKLRSSLDLSSVLLEAQICVFVFTNLHPHMLVFVHWFHTYLNHQVLLPLLGTTLWTNVIYQCLKTFLMAVPTDLILFL